MKKKQAKKLAKALAAEFPALVYTVVPADSWNGVTLTYGIWVGRWQRDEEPLRLRYISDLSSALRFAYMRDTYMPLETIK